MFDDLILLAKGGLTAYHGPVKKVEEYFSGIGINVPDRVNPPDYYIDILEGIVKPSVSSGLNYKQLPIKWMQHNGYVIPPDMLDLLGADSSADKSTKSSTETDETASESDVHTIAGEVWGDIKCLVEKKKDNIGLNFTKSVDLSNRTTPGYFPQYKYYFGRQAGVLY